MLQTVTSDLVGYAQALDGGTKKDAEALGGYAQALEISPVATLTATGAIVGALWGALAGWIGAALIDRDRMPTWILVGSASGALILGADGRQQGIELQQWLKQY